MIDDKIPTMYQACIISGDKSKIITPSIIRVDKETYEPQPLQTLVSNPVELVHISLPLLKSLREYQNEFNDPEADLIVRQLNVVDSESFIGDVLPKGLATEIFEAIGDPSNNIEISVIDESPRKDESFH